MHGIGARNTSLHKLQGHGRGGKAVRDPRRYETTNDSTIPRS